MSSFSRNMDGLAEFESARFLPPKIVQEEDSLFAKSKTKITQYRDTGTSGPLRFSEIGKQLASKNSL